MDIYIVDTTGKFLATDVANGDYVAAFADVTGAKANAAMLLNKGFLQGKMDQANYNGSVEAKTYSAAGQNNATTNIPIVVRPYAVYTLNGVDITIYGAAQVLA